MKEFLFEIKEELHENGIFFVLLLFVFGVPAFLVSCLAHIIFSPFVFLNEWSKTWFTGDSL